MHAPGEKPSLQTITPLFHFTVSRHENGNGFITEHDIITHRYNTVVHDFPRFLGNYMHAQTVDTRPGLCIHIAVKELLQS